MRILALLAVLLVPSCALVERRTTIVVHTVGGRYEATKAWGGEYVQGAVIPDGVLPRG